MSKKAEARVRAISVDGLSVDETRVRAIVAEALIGKIGPVFLSPDKAAQFLDVPIPTLAEWRTSRRRGSGPAFTRDGGTVRYAVADLMAWAAKHKVGA